MMTNPLIFLWATCAPGGSFSEGARAFTRSGPSTVGCDSYVNSLVRTYAGRVYMEYHTVGCLLGLIAKYWQTVKVGAFISSMKFTGALFFLRYCAITHPAYYNCKVQVD